MAAVPNAQLAVVLDRVAGYDPANRLANADGLGLVGTSDCGNRTPR